MGKTSGSDKLDADAINEYASANDPVLRAKVKGDAHERLVIEADGSVLSGDGTAAPTAAGFAPAGQSRTGDGATCLTPS